jgi:hypothetical protein
MRFYPICFQWSAGRPQAGDRNLCSVSGKIAQKASGARVFEIRAAESLKKHSFEGAKLIVEIA